LNLHPTYHQADSDHQVYYHHCPSDHHHPTGLYLKWPARYRHCFHRPTCQNLEGLAYCFHRPTYQFLEEPALSLQFHLAGTWAHTLQGLVQLLLLQQQPQALDRQEAQKAYEAHQLLFPREFPSLPVPFLLIHVLFVSASLLSHPTSPCVQLLLSCVSQPLYLKTTNT
jgi:hypothetical protein